MLLAKKDFRENLKYVKDNKGEVIDSITEKCTLNTQHAQAYTEALFEEIREARLDRKVSLLFLIDSILKNCKRPYQEYIQKGIIEAFCDTYELAKDRPEMRRELRFLFKVWELYFSHTTLLSIDASLKLKIGEDINASLTIEELDHIIAHYKRIKEDPGHLILQKELLLKMRPQKVVKKEKKEEKEESSLIVPDYIKAALDRKPPPEKPAKPIRPKPAAPSVALNNGNGSAGVTQKKPVGEPVLLKKLEGEPKVKRPEADLLQKKSDIRPAMPKKPENGDGHRKMEVEVPVKRIEGSSGIKRPAGEEPPIKKKTAVRREKPGIEADEQAFAAKKKMVKPDQGNSKNVIEPPLARPQQKVPLAPTKPPGEMKIGQKRESLVGLEKNIPEKPAVSNKVVTNKMSSNPEQEPPKKPAYNAQQRTHQQEQQRSPEESYEMGVFSDDESNAKPQKQPPPVDNGYLQSNMDPRFQRQQPQHIQPPLMQQQQQPQLQPQPQPQHQNYPYQPQHPQFQPQSHFQGPPQNPQSQYSRPNYRNVNPQPMQPQLQQSYPQVGQFQQTPQLQPFQQVHHSQSHPSHFQSQPPFQNQPMPSNMNMEQGLRTGPGQYQNRHYNPPIQQQQQRHNYNQYPHPYQPQDNAQPQYRQGMEPEQQPPVIPVHDGDRLLEIRNMLMTSRKQGVEPPRPVPQEFSPEYQIPLNARKDSFPDPRNFRQSSEIQSYDQGNVLVFRSLLHTIKKELPGSIKAKYEHKMGRIGSLSEMIVRRDFRIVETLYEDLIYRCSSCGMRFSHRTLLDKHLDAHLRFNMELKEKTKTMNLRSQLITTEHWIKDEGHKNFKTANIENGEDDFEFENYVPSSEEQKRCEACGEPFKEVWDKDKETWLLDTATQVKYKEEEGGDDGKQKNGTSYDLMHFRCYKLCLQNEPK